MKPIIEFIILLFFCTKVDKNVKKCKIIVRVDRVEERELWINLTKFYKR